MKLTHILLALSAVFALTGCHSTKPDSSTSAEVSTLGSESPKGDYKNTETNTGSGLLMDRYKSGKIPGLHE